MCLHISDHLVGRMLLMLTRLRSVSASSMQSRSWVMWCRWDRALVTSPHVMRHCYVVESWVG
jgi:hypothetical protein